MVACCNVSNNDYTQFVDPFIGTGGHGHTFPGPVMPHGMIQPSPDTRIDGWDACSGYHYTDSLVVIGGDVTGAMKYIKPALLREMRSTINTIGGETLNRLPLTVFDLDNVEEFRKFALGESRELKVYGSDDTVIYDPMKRTGLAVTSIGASKAISIGAYSYALAQIDARR